MPKTFAQYCNYLNLVEFVDNMAQNIDQIKNLQLRLELEICGLSVEALSKFA